MTVRRPRTLTRAIDPARFRKAVAEGLPNKALAERFGVCEGTASKLAAPLRAPKKPRP